MWNRIAQLRENLYSVIDGLSASLGEFVENPGKDFVRIRKLPFTEMLKLFMSIGGGSLGNELLEATGFIAENPTVSAFVQQRQKILPTAVYELLRRFAASLDLREKHRGYRVLAVDGSYLAVAPDPSGTQNFFQAKNAGKGYSMLHLNALYDVSNKVHIDAEGQNEFRALVDMAGRTVGNHGGDADSKRYCWRTEVTEVTMFSRNFSEWA
jgi:hypothetical protein